MECTQLNDTISARFDFLEEFCGTFVTVEQLVRDIEASFLTSRE